MIKKRWIAIGSDMGMISIIDFRTGRIIFKFRAHDLAILKVYFSFPFNNKK